MKKDVHPEYQECLVTCACGNSFKTRSTKGEIRVEICSQCHPFFTGKQKFIDSAGRVEKFKKKFGDAKDIKAAKDARAARTAHDVKSLAKKKKSSR
jgi:large subunit ribosomal protein L31